MKNNHPFLKIAGVNSIDEFYQKFPTEEAFMAKHGAKLKKAQLGLSQPKAMPVNIPGIPILQPQTIESKYKKGFEIKDKDALENVGYNLLNKSGRIIGLSKDIFENKKDAERTKLYAKIADEQMKATQDLNSRASNIKRKYVRPEDQMVDPNELMNPYGVGTNYLAAEDGAMIGGNPTEIQNMYTTPNTMYTDLAYEPLNDSSKVKQFQFGGFLKNAGKVAGAVSPIGGGLGSLIGGGRFETNSGGALGGDIGGTIGGIATAFTGIPGLDKVGELAGGLIGGAFGADEAKQREKDQIKLENNAQQLAFNNFLKGNSAVMKDGGWVSHDWQPQVIAKFGDADVSQVHAFAQDGMPQYRAGGHLKEYTPPSAAAMYTGRRAEDGVQMAMSGDLQVARGSADTMSYNPYLPGDGETVMFRGPSHDDGGMPVSFGQNGVEVEGGEPAIKMQDGGKQENLVVYGNMPIPDYGVNEINDPKAKGKKFKHYIADLSKQEAKVNKSVEKGVELVNNYDTGNEFDQLAFNSGKAMMMGGDLKLKTIAERKMDAAAVQNAILDTAEEFGVKSDDLAKGKLKMDKDNKMYAEFGKKIKFQTGGKAKQLPVTLSTIAETLPSSFLSGLSEEDIAARAKEASATPAFIPGISKLPNINYGEFNIKNYIPSQRSFFEGIPMKNSYGVFDPLQGEYVPGELDNVTVTAKRLNNAPVAPSLELYQPSSSSSTSEDSDKPSWWDAVSMAISSASPFLRPSSARPLDPSQIAPEMMALTANQLEPVQAQTFQPLLSTPTSYSLQDQLNEVTSATRAAEKMSAYNPEAASMIAAQAYNAKNKILGEQFRMNQAERQRVAEQNRNVLNDANLKNLAIYDTQYQRQEQAKSATKTQALEAMKSIADKVAKNKLENRQLGVMENLYNYRFTKSGQAYNLNAPQFFNMSGSLAKNQEAAPEGWEWEKTLKKKKDDDKRNGAIVKAIKNL